MANLVTVRHGSSVFLLAGIYFYGCSNTLWAFDTIDGTFRELPRVQEVRGRPAMAIQNDTVVVAGDDRPTRNRMISTDSIARREGWMFSDLPLVRNTLWCISPEAGVFLYIRLGNEPLESTSRCRQNYHSFFGSVIPTIRCHCPL